MWMSKEQQGRIIDIHVESPHDRISVFFSYIWEELKGVRVSDPISLTTTFLCTRIIYKGTRPSHNSHTRQSIHKHAILSYGKTFR